MSVCSSTLCSTVQGNDGNASKDYTHTLSVQLPSVGSIDPELASLGSCEKSSVWCEFGDDECGEPFHDQHLVLDFTPDDRVDNKETLQKCCDFWEMIHRHPEIHHLMVVPEPFTSDTTSSRSSSATKTQSSTNSEVANTKTAVSMLELCTDNKLLSSALETKMCASWCSMKPIDSSVDKDSEIREIIKKQPEGDPKSQLSKLKAAKLCKEVQDWDMNHQKSFDPPRRYGY